MKSHLFSFLFVVVVVVGVVGEVNREEGRLLISRNRAPFEIPAMESKRKRTILRFFFFISPFFRVFVVFPSPPHHISDFFFLSFPLVKKNWKEEEEEDKDNKRARKLNVQARQMRGIGS